MCTMNYEGRMLNSVCSFVLPQRTLKDSLAQGLFSIATKQNIEDEDENCSVSQVVSCTIFNPWPSLLPPYLPG